MHRQNLKEYELITLWQEEGHEPFIFFTYSPNLEMDLGKAKGIVQSRLEYSQGKPCYYLIDVTNLKSVTKEAREYMSDKNEGLSGVLGGAFISNKVLTTVIVNFFFNINKPSVPARFFTNRDDALIWLRKLKNQAVL